MGVCLKNMKVFCVFDYVCDVFMFKVGSIDLVVFVRISLCGFIFVYV